MSISFALAVAGDETRTWANKNANKYNICTSIPIGRTDRNTRHQHINDCALSILLYLALVYPALEGQGAGLTFFWFCDIPTQAQTNMPPAYPILLSSSHRPFPSKPLIVTEGFQQMALFRGLVCISVFHFLACSSIQPSIIQTKCNSNPPPACLTPASPGICGTLAITVTWWKIRIGFSCIQNVYWSGG